MESFASEEYNTVQVARMLIPGCYTSQPFSGLLLCEHYVATAKLPLCCSTMYQPVGMVDKTPRPGGVALTMLGCPELAWKSGHPRRAELTLDL